MTYQLDRLSFSTVLDTHPDRYGKVNLANARIESLDGPEFVVERAESDDAHACQLVRSLSHSWGSCTCDGYEYHSGACSHLCAVWRAYQLDLIEVPAGEPTKLSVEVRNTEEERAQHAAEPELTGAEP